MMRLQFLRGSVILMTRFVHHHADVRTFYSVQRKITSLELENNDATLICCDYDSINSSAQYVTLPGSSYNHLIFLCLNSLFLFWLVVTAQTFLFYYHLVTSLEKNLTCKQLFQVDAKSLTFLLIVLKYSIMITLLVQIY